MILASSKISCFALCGFLLQSFVLKLSFIAYCHNKKHHLEESLCILHFSFAKIINMITL